MDFHTVTRDRYGGPLPHNKKKHLDLRNVEHFNKFGAHRYTFKFRVQDPLEFHLHSDTSQRQINFMTDGLEVILREAAFMMARDGRNLNGIIQIFMIVQNIKRDFVWDGVGSDKILLGELLHNPKAADQIVSEWMNVIQSNEDAILNNSTILQMYVFEPPPDFKGQIEPRYGYAVAL